MSFGTGGLLIAAAAGYLVLERAEAHKKGLRQIGRWVGWIIILVSFGGVVCVMQRCAKGPMMRGYCPMSSKTAPAPSNP